MADVWHGPKNTSGVMLNVSLKKLPKHFFLDAMKKDLKYWLKVILIEWLELKFCLRIVSGSYYSVLLNPLSATATHSKSIDWFLYEGNTGT